MTHGGAWAGPKEGLVMLEIEDLIPLPVVAKRAGLAPRTVYDRNWRRRVGLPVVKLGGRILGVRAQDLAACLRREFEPVPPKDGAAGTPPGPAPGGWRRR